MLYGISRFFIYFESQSYREREGDRGRDRKREREREEIDRDLPSSGPFPQTATTASTGPG